MRAKFFYMDSIRYDTQIYLLLYPNTYLEVHDMGLQMLIWKSRPESIGF
jgi:hypothetical protein